jgi:hypothetical protein
MSEIKTPGQAVLSVLAHRLSADNGLDLVTWDELDADDCQMLEDAGRNAIAAWQRQNAEVILALPDALDDLAATEPDYRALVGKSTAAHWNVGLPGEQKIANAHRREAGLEELT